MRVLVVVNKWWECDPALAAMVNNNTRPPNSPWPKLLRPARKPPELVHHRNESPEPRAVFEYRSFSAEVWCISDLLEGYTAEQQSSSQRKAELLGKIFQGQSAGLVIAVGTASTPDMTNRNGGAVVGTSVFMHNGHPNGSNPDSNLNLPVFDKLVESPISAAMFAKLAAADTKTAANRFLPVPLHPAPEPALSIELGAVALGTINVSKSADYATADPETLHAFQALGTSAQPVSVETTHGLIRIQSESPFIFVSGIVNRFQQFGTDVAPRMDAQNTAGAHNAGVAVTWLLAALDA